MKTTTHPPALRWLGTFAVALLATAAITAESRAAPVNRVDFIDATEAAAQFVEVETFPLGAQHGLPVITATARTYPYRCTFSGKLLPRQRVEAVCHLPRGSAGALLSPMPIVQVLTGSVVIDSALVAIERAPLRVRITLHNTSGALELLRATVDVY